MAWEVWNGRRYYTRSRWVSGRVVREYVGAEGSPMAELAAAEDAMRREARERARGVRRSQEAQDAEVDLSVETLATVGAALLGATLVVAGYRQHDRGAWRKQRG